jgi:hypothetical protein
MNGTSCGSFSPSFSRVNYFDDAYQDYSLDDEGAGALVYEDISSGLGHLTMDIDDIFIPTLDDCRDDDRCSRNSDPESSDRTIVSPRGFTPRFSPEQYEGGEVVQEEDGESINNAIISLQDQKVAFSHIKDIVCETLARL